MCCTKKSFCGTNVFVVVKNHTNDNSNHNLLPTLSMTTKESSGGRDSGCGQRKRLWQQTNIFSDSNIVVMNGTTIKLHSSATRIVQGGLRHGWYCDKIP